MKVVIVGAIVLASVISSISYAQAGNDLNVGLSASTACENKRVRIDWTITNLEEKSVTVVASDVVRNERTTTISADPNETITSSFITDARQTDTGEIAFELSKTGNTVEKTASYEARVCSEEPEEDSAPTRRNETPPPPSADDLPNTGPLDGIALYMAATLAFGSAWLVTRKELIRTLKNN